ncbi:hypothetical protein OIU76_021057 [Salix suchowensis]|nr:hypothetical protein OIU76_021057 [Salix suchowensis]
METRVSGAQLAKKSEYSFGAVTGIRLVKRRERRRRDSSERRKKPRREETGFGALREEATETECTEIVTCPVGVKPNFSKTIMARESLVIDRVLISAVVRERRARRTTGRRRCGGLVILRGGC